MIIEVLKDPWTHVAAAGTTLMIMMEWIATHVSPLIALIGGLLGLVMLVLGIIEKINSNKIKTLEIRKLKNDLKE